MFFSFFSTAPRLTTVSMLSCNLGIATGDVFLPLRTLSSHASSALSATYAHYLTFCAGGAGPSPVPATGALTSYTSYQAWLLSFAVALPDHPDCSRADFGHFATWLLNRGVSDQLA